MKAKYILLIFIFILSIIYLSINNYIYYYGLSNGLFSSELPHKFKPKYLDWEYGNKGFSFENEYEIYVLYKENTITIDNKDYTISEIEAYYFDKEKLILELNIENEKTFVLVSKNRGKGQQFLYHRIKDENISQIISGTKQINVKENLNKAKNCKILLNYLSIVIVLLSTFFIIILVRRKNSNNVKELGNQ